MGVQLFSSFLLTWTGYTIEAFSGLYQIQLLSGVMLCLDSRCYTIVLLVTGNLNIAEIELDALSIWLTKHVCMYYSGKTYIINS
ncbi:protein DETOXIFICATION 26-like [Ziziphus jujuba]|uniref:Protein DETOXIFICATION 26-like n=1 Tax=Ziziphus jujuba TaxID=326968 RepID=A0ABM3IUH3_ZIZJJ|nr:protein DETOXIFICATION 26-like [Ziziphus jujuba]